MKLLNREGSQINCYDEAKDEAFFTSEDTKRYKLWCCDPTPGDPWGDFVYKFNPIVA